MLLALSFRDLKSNIFLLRIASFSCNFFSSIFPLLLGGFMVGLLNSLSFFLLVLEDTVDTGYMNALIISPGSDVEGGV